MKRKRYSRKFQRMAVERMETCDDVGELARELGVRPRCIYKWRKKLESIEPGQEESAAIALGARLSISPKSSSNRIEAPSSAESRGATMVFFENKDNDRKISKGLLGKGTQMPSPSPDPSPASRCQNAVRKVGAVSPKLCQSRGSPHKLGPSLGPTCPFFWRLFRG